MVMHGIFNCAGVLQMAVLCNTVAQQLLRIQATHVDNDAFAILTTN